MARGRRDPQRNRWLLPAALTLTAAVATAGVYFWKEMEDHEAATGFRSEDEETADERRRRSRGMAGRSFGDQAAAAGAGISTKVSEIWKGFFESSDESDSGKDKNRPGPSMSGAAKAAAAAGVAVAGGAAAGSYSDRERISTRSMPAEVPMLGNSQEIDWEKKRIIALVISSYEELDESLLLSLPTPVDISRWILLIFVYSRAGYSSASEVERPSTSSSISKRFGRRRGDRQDSSAEDDDDIDMESGETSVDVTLPGLILKTFGRDFPHQQVMHYSTPTGVVHMLRHLGVSIVFLSESCASVPNPGDGSSADEGGDPQHVPGSLPMSPPPGGVNPAGGGEIVGMLKDWVREIIVVLDEDEDDSAPLRPSAVSGGEDDYDRSRRKKGKMRLGGGGAVGENTGRKRRWLKDKNLSRGIMICDRPGLKGIWRTKVEGGR